MGGGIVWGDCSHARFRQLGQRSMYCGSGKLHSADTLVPSGGGQSGVSVTGNHVTAVLVSEAYVVHISSWILGQ